MITTSDKIREQIQEGQHLANEFIRGMIIDTTFLSPIALETFKEELYDQLKDKNLLPSKPNRITER